MGQLITVSSRPGAAPEAMIFDLNRSLTGMAIERYPSIDDVHARRPPDVLARRLFDLGATQVTIYSNVVTVDAPADRWADLVDPMTAAIVHLFEYYGDDAGWSPAALGVEPAPVEVAAEAPAELAAPAAG